MRHSDPSQKRAGGTFGLLSPASRRIALAFFVGSLVVFAPVVNRLPAADDANQSTIKLVIDYNDGVQKVFPTIGWKEGMTVLDAMQEAKAPAHGITFKYTGKGETAFLKQIEDVTNEGAGKDKKNWQFWINGSYAETGFGASKLNAGDTVVWKFTVFEDK